LFFLFELFYVTLAGFSIILLHYIS